MKYKITIFLFITVSFISCGILLTKKKDFSLYKQNLYENSAKLNTNGAFISKNDCNPYHLYLNGEVCYGYEFGLNYKNNNVVKLDNNQLKYDTLEFNKKRHRQQEYWGHYKIKNDTLIMQIFNYNFVFLYNRFICEDRAIIINDTSFVMYDFKSYYNKRDKRSRFMVRPDTFYLYKTTLKPDSSKAWFVDKKWYLDSLHNSRKLP